MTQLTTTLVINDKYKAPEGAIETNEDYINFVVNRAAQSYKTQYAVKDVVSGITAAREAYNDDLNAI